MTDAAAPKILLVDDRDENLYAMHAMLRSSGAEIHEARSGRDALELLLDNDYAVAILDVHMPEMDGFEVAQLMRGRVRSRAVPVVFVTAGAGESALARGYGVGAVDFLFKPIDPDVLRTKTQVFLELHRQRLELAARLSERDRLIDELQRTLRLNEMFSAVLGHDLRTPLGAILNSATAILQGGAEPDRIREAATRIRRSGDRMARMIEQLLDFARARVGSGIAIARVDVDVTEIAARVLAEIPDGRGRVQLRVEGSARARLDPDRMGQAISNLCSNAVEHGDPGQAVVVTIDGSLPDWITLRVENGGAIAEDLLPRLFDPFRPGDGRRTRSTGLGLGLYIVQQIVNVHGGRISVSSTPHGGTVFTVELPRGNVAVMESGAGLGI